MPTASRPSNGLKVTGLWKETSGARAATIAGWSRASTAARKGWVVMAALFHDTPKSIDLVLYGGGVLRGGHVGAVSVLREAAIEVKRIAGPSAGSIVGALLAAGMEAAEAHELI